MSVKNNDNDNDAKIAQSIQGLPFLRNQANFFSGYYLHLKNFRDLLTMVIAILENLSYYNINTYYDNYYKLNIIKLQSNV